MRRERLASTEDLLPQRHEVAPNFPTGPAKSRTWMNLIFADYQCFTSSPADLPKLSPSEDA